MKNTGNGEKDTIKTINCARDRGDVNGSNGPPVLSIDIGEFRPLLEESGIPEDQKREWLELVWQIVCQFVDLGFQADPVSRAVQAKEKEDIPPALAAPGWTGGSGRAYSTFNMAAGHVKQQKENLRERIEL